MADDDGLQVKILMANRVARAARFHAKLPSLGYDRWLAFYARFHATEEAARHYLRIVRGEIIPLGMR